MMLKNILIVIGGLAGLLAVYVFLIPMLQNPALPQQGDMVACTMDAKMCPDGSYVGRTGPACEFSPCPNDGVMPEVSAPGVSSPLPENPEPVFCTADVKECPDGSYVGRVGPSCAFAACPGE